MSGKLSTHVLDTVSGKPAAGVVWTLSFQDASGNWHELGSGRTNSNGRTDKPLLADAELKTGTYRLVFDMGRYFRDQGCPLADPPFLNSVVLQVSLQAGESYHLPLLASPWSYSTYRGS